MNDGIDPTNSEDLERQVFDIGPDQNILTSPVIDGKIKQMNNKRTPSWQAYLLKGTDFKTIEGFYHLKFKEHCIGAEADVNGNKPRFLLNDIGIAALFREVHTSILTVVDETSEYFVYDGTRWRADKGLVAEICKCFVTALASYSKGTIVDTLIPKGKEFLDFETYAAGFHSHNKRKTLLSDAATMLRTPLEVFDAKPFIINLLNGSYNLSKMEFRAHRPDDYLTMISRVMYNPDAKCDRWIKFISEIMENDPDKIRYLKKALGYGLSGDRSERSFLALYGLGTTNGKSTLIGVIEYLLGDYAKTAQPQTIAKRNASGSAPSPDLARLKGVRVVNMPEPSKNFELDAALIKQLTGGDPITTRFLRGNPFQFIPEFLIIITTNHLLQITDPSVIKSGRMKIIWFNKSFAENADTTLKQDFREPEAMSAILTWLLEGYELYTQDGHLEPPETIKTEIESFRKDASGQLEEFLNTNLVADANSKTKVSDIHRRHSEWANESGLKRLSKHAFLPALKDKYPDSVKRDSILGNVLEKYVLLPLTNGNPATAPTGDTLKNENESSSDVSNDSSDEP